ncbi:hypothetical protein [Enterococcus gilvus]|uniref:hypothetical protein n=1 Tax=Enterococcus gilvus TaxID=160453 RepID=UPI00345E7987
MELFYQLIHKLNLRKVVFVVFVWVTVIGYLKQKHKHSAPELTDDELEATYGKNEAGLFPWEADTNDSPDRVKKTTKKYNIKQYGPKRGRW